MANEVEDDELLDEYRAAYRAANGSEVVARHSGGTFYVLIRSAGREKAFDRADFRHLTEQLRIRAREVQRG